MLAVHTGTMQKQGRKEIFLQNTVEIFGAIFLCIAEPNKYFNTINIMNSLLIDLRR